MSQDIGASSAERTHTKFSSGTDSSISITTVTSPFKTHYLTLRYSALYGIVEWVFSLLLNGHITNQKPKKMIYSLQVGNICDLASLTLVLISCLYLFTSGMETPKNQHLLQQDKSANSEPSGSSQATTTQVCATFKLG